MNPTVALAGSMTWMGIRLSSGSRRPQSPDATASPSYGPREPCCGSHWSCAIVELKDHVGRSRIRNHRDVARSTGHLLWARAILDGGRLPLSYRTAGPQGL